MAKKQEPARSPLKPGTVGYPEHEVKVRATLKERRFDWDKHYNKNSKIKNKKITNPYKDLSIDSQQRVISWGYERNLVDYDLTELIPMYCKENKHDIKHKLICR